MRNHLVLAATALLLLASPLQAAHLCTHCGCQRNCKKICRLVCGKKKEKKTVYDCECEDFCVPGCSKKCGVKIECDGEGRHRKIIWQPTCARVHTRKKLVKDEVTKEVPDYKWVVEEYCCVCGHLIKTSGDGEQGKADGKKAERLPVPPSSKLANDSLPPETQDAFHAYYLETDHDASVELTSADVASDGTVGAKLARRSEAKFDLPLEEPEDDCISPPQRLFFGLFGR